MRKNESTDLNEGGTTKSTLSLSQHPFCLSTTASAIKRNNKKDKGQQGLPKPKHLWWPKLKK